jgi:hypothetical protein
MRTARNILFILADQWRADSLSVAGHPVVQTPTLDALARDGVLFKQHYAQASPCGPSRTSILTGMYLQNHRSARNGTPLDARFTNIARELRKAGYDPGLIGYTDTSADPRGRDPEDPALRTYEGVMPGFTPILLMPEDPVTWLAYLRRLGYRGPAPRPRRCLAAGRKLSRGGQARADLRARDLQGGAQRHGLHDRHGAGLHRGAQGRAVVPASRLSASASALHRAGTL